MTLPDFKNSTEWASPLNRVAVSLDADGRFVDVVSDAPVEFYVVQHSCTKDPVYRFGSIETGKDMVDFMFNGATPGSAEDGKSDDLIRKIYGQ